MKREDLERHLQEHGCCRYRKGAGHDIWINPANNAQAPIPRHNEINTFTALGICRQLDVPIPTGR